MVRRSGDLHHVLRLEKADKPPRFVQNIPQPRRSYIDLADIVAGGDGFGRATQSGIDSSTGAIIKGPPGSFGTDGDGRYYRVEKLPFVNGVFVPDGGQGPVQLDSAGHQYSAFTDTDNRTWGYIWSGKYPSVRVDVSPLSCWLGGVDYSGKPHSVLCMPTNKGITFDLKAIRHANPNLEIINFTAVAGNTETRSDKIFADRVSADFWVFVDGQLRVSKTDVNSGDGPLAINVPLAPNTRFLTLSTTDAGNMHHFDWTMFGDPHLIIKSVGGGHKTRSPDATGGKEGTPMEH